MSRRAVNRATLARQLLLEPADLSIPQAIHRLVGLQSQAPFPPYTGLWTRLQTFDPHDLGQLIIDRQVVRIAVMRGTVHLVTADDCLALRPVIQPILDRWLAQTVSRSLGEVDPGEVGVAAATMLAEQPRSVAELGAALLAYWPHVDPGALANAARGTLPLVQLPPRAVWGKSGRTVVTTAQHWLNRTLAEPDVDAVVLRYLSAFGPASVADVQKWSGLTRLGEVVERLRPQLAVFADEAGRPLFDRPDAPRPHERTPAPVRFLPEFDNLLISYANTVRIMDPTHRGRVFSANGLIAATVLVDGFVQATWKITKTRPRAMLAIDALGTLSAATRRAIEAEGRRLLAFHAPDLDPDIRFAPT